MVKQKLVYDNFQEFSFNRVDLTIFHNQNPRNLLFQSFLLKYLRVDIKIFMDLFDFSEPKLNIYIFYSFQKNKNKLANVPFKNFINFL